MKNLNYRKPQQGAALAIGMFLLLIISVIGISSMKSSILQEKMAANLQNRELADAAALTLLQAAEARIYNQYSTFESLSTEDEGVVVSDSPQSVAIRNDRDVESSDGFYLTIDGLTINERFGGKLKEEPIYIIEDIMAPTALDVAEVGGQNFTATYEFHGSGSGGAGGGGGGGTAGTASGGLKDMQIFRIVAKATDTTGNIYSAFESVFSVRTN